MKLFYWENKPGFSEGCGVLTLKQLGEFLNNEFYRWAVAAKVGDKFETKVSVYTCTSAGN